MRWLRVSLRAPLVAILLLGLTFGALRTPSMATYRAVESALLLSIGVAILAARFVPGKAGAFGFGFAAWAGSYYVLVNTSWRVAHLLRTLSWAFVGLMHPPLPDTTPFAAANYAEFAEFAVSLCDGLMAYWLGLLGGLLAVAMAAKFGTIPGRSGRNP